ncbi:probable cysteine--tRNA ligase, mitochondrial isoform X1 [Varanus komodoensis]|uniref:probable cysteine--tRNA ligase, mitochondrial isoform X1 n=1 Tax=Varanus komodoensis TaxID=61221 RepID=UPI001CF7A536|nr:probable cysteine--tRNA ligase, mitochondrial isoform X1 [Varanus komodoensis]
MFRVLTTPWGAGCLGAAARGSPWWGPGRCARLALEAGGATPAGEGRLALDEASPRRRCCGAPEHGTKWIKPTGRDTGIQTYNSLSKSKEPLILGDTDVVTWYSCGPTVYDHAHLGHACSYVRFDIIRRIMTKIFGKEVIMVMGITDIDDKIIKRANEMGISPVSLARFYEEDFKQDMAALKVLPPTIYMRVTENIPQIIAFIQQIIIKGHGYATSKGNVYFDVSSRGDRYGKLVTISPDAQEEPVDGDKRHVKDFALWKAAKPQEIYWDSPWGKGRPGWHIECSTISSLVFGGHLDIHTGGIDLAFPHHENEIAQCEVYHQCEQWGNYFLHSGHLHTKGSEKMSKSLKNYITIKDFLKEFSSEQFRMFCLRSKYRSAVEYSEDSLNDAKNTLQAIYSFMSSANTYMKGQLLCEAIKEDVLWEMLAHTKATVKAACADDFDTPRAVGAIMGLIHHGNRQLKAVTKETGSPRSAVVFGAIVSYIEEFFNTFGIALSEAQVAPEHNHPAILSSVIDELVRFRIKVRNFALAVPAAAESAPTEGAHLSEEPKQIQKEERQRLLKDRAPLLQACDSLRQDLALYGQKYYFYMGTRRPQQRTGKRLIQIWTTLGVV